MVGVSIVICCHNSEQRLPSTLRHVARQIGSTALLWEVIIVDNASTDGTAGTARLLWSDNEQTQLHIVREPQIGLNFARQAGFAAAKYDIVSFVDDDNWISPHWVNTISEIMGKHPEVGACGGYSHSVFESPPPIWFTKFQGAYAVGSQSDISGDITWTRGYLWGAGLTIRKAAWSKLKSAGFRPLLSDRQGNHLISGGDTELCYALRLSGWRIWYDERLQLTHYMPSSRLTWHYLRKLVFGFGMSTVCHDAYLQPHLSSDRIRTMLRRWWVWQVYQLLKILIGSWRTVLSGVSSRQEGNSDTIWLEWHLGRLCELLRQRRQYARNLLEVQAANWR